MHIYIYIYAGVSQNDEPPFVGRNHLFFGADNFEMYTNTPRWVDEE